MRIVGGKFRSRQLAVPPQDITRPTSDRAREALFNIIGNYPEFSLEGAQVADVFAGSGALGLEALSRGAMHVTFFEKNPSILQALRHNIESLGVKSQTTIIRTDALKPPQAINPMDLILFDPPYGAFDPGQILQAFDTTGWIGANSLMVFEQSSKAPALILDRFTILQTRTYGAASLSFLKRT